MSHEASSHAAPREGGHSHSKDDARARLARAEDLLSGLARSHGVSVSLLLTDQGTPRALVERPYCRDLHARCPGVERRCQKELEERTQRLVDRGEDYEILRCPGGLTSLVTPLRLAGRHAGALVIGSCRTAPLDGERLERMALELGIGRSDLGAALDEVPRLGEAQLIELGELFAEVVALASASEREGKASGAPREGRSASREEASPASPEHAPSLLEEREIDSLFVAEEKTSGAGEGALSEGACAAEGRTTSAPDEDASLTSDFLGALGEQIKTPLNGLLGHTGFLLDTALDEEQRTHAAAASECAEELLGLANDLLDFARLDAGVLEIAHEPFDPRSVVEDVVDALAYAAHGKGLCFSAEVDEDLPCEVIGDAQVLRHVVTKLAASALKATDEGFVRLGVSLGEEEPRGEGVALLFEIEDSREQETLFPAPGRSEGAVLLDPGLAMAQRFGALVGGQVSVSARDEQGARLAFAAKLGAAPGATPPPAPAGLGDVRVLLALDEHAHRVSIVRQLVQWGVRVEETGRVDTALSMLRVAAECGDPFRILVVTAELEGRSTAPLLAALRGPNALSPATLPLPAVHAGMRADLEAFASLGAVEPLTLPARRSRLIASLQHTLAGMGRDEHGRRSAARRHEEFVAERGRVLVAEPTGRRPSIAQRMLERAGFRVVVVGCASECVRALERERFDALVVNLEESEEAGLDAARSVRRHPREALHVLPLVALGSARRLEDRARLDEAGVDVTIGIPLAREELVEGVLRAIALASVRCASVEEE